MIAHIVFIKLKDKSTAGEVKSVLESLPPKIEQIKKYEVGIDEVGSARSFDMSLYSQFESYDEMQVYQEHPDHVEALAVIRARAETVYAVDYTL